MFKKSLIFLLALTANLFANANPIIKIGSFVDTLSVNYTKFAEPAVTVFDGSTNVTKQYAITYGIDGGTEETDDRGVRIVKDPVTKATVEKYYGGVNTGMAGNVTIKVYATSKETGEVIESQYSLVVKSNGVKLTFAPQFGTSVNGHDGSLTLSTSRISNNSATNPLYYIPSTSSILPVYTLTTTTTGGTSIDVSEYYNVNISYSGNSKITFANNTLSYSGLGTQYYISKTEKDVNDEISDLNSTSNTLTYSFTPKAEYVGIYEAITRVIDVNVDIDTTGAKHKVHLSLSRELFNHDNVTGSEEEGYTIHVYKWGLSDMGTGHHYQYSNPLPSVLTKGGAQLGTRVDSKGNWGDFKYYFRIITDSTYYDDCWHAGTIQKAGESTGIVFYEDRFQVKKPGMIKVAVYACLPDNYGEPLKAAYEPLLDENGDTVRFENSTMYSEPVYFYIDVMKRVADLKFDPDPSTIVFAKGDKVYIPERFNVYGEIDDNSNGVAAGLLWDDQNSGEQWIDGKKYEIFDYSFFISDRMNNNYIRLNNWPYDAGRHKEDWIAASALAIGTDVAVGDKILVNGEYVLLTEDNIADYAGRKIQEGDLEHGITYLAMKKWGNERWTIEFLQTGRYTIPYTIRPWNHEAWDDGGDNNGWSFLVEGTISTEIQLSYSFQTAPMGLTDFDEPDAKVIAPAMNNYDITGKYTFTYSIDSDASATGTTIDAATGEVKIGNKVGDVVIRVHADRNSTYQTIEEVYENPDDAFYTIRIINQADVATWEIVSENKDCQLNTSHFRDASKVNGRFHFLTAGNVYGGTVITGVPGITMTIGTPATFAAEATEWQATVSDLQAVHYCQHETGNGVVANCSNRVVLDEDNIPTAGCFYQFNPTVNGYLTVDAKFCANDMIVLISKSSSGETVQEDTIFTAETLTDCTFSKALIAGQTYYLYNMTNHDDSNNGISLHGFTYQPAYIIDRNTTLSESEEELDATTFMNGLSSTLPTILSTANSNVSFEILPGEYTLIEPSDYVTIESDGKVNPLQMTMADEDIFYVVVKATVKSSDKTLGDCVTKTSQYRLKIIDIPTYAVTDEFENYPGDEVTTENIFTDIVMTYGGSNFKYGNNLYDNWNYKSIAGPADRIGYGEASELTTYNKTIDGFELFAAGNNNPLDELNQNALHDGHYLYGSGIAFEDDEHNTTYDLPCRGNYLKFEPRESGTILVYLVQNGCCSYHYGITTITKEYQLKWLPLYITDETGKPVTMVNDFGAISKYLPTGKDQTNAGSYTLGISRCNKQEAAISAAWDHEGVETYGTSFDWSKFSGTDEDREKLLNAWTAKGERMSIIRLEDGGFVLPHKAYVRYTFQVKAGKTYFIFQPGSKFEFGGFSFVPTGYPNHSKYGLNCELNKTNMEKNVDGNAGNITSTSFTWNNGEGTVNLLDGDAENLIIDVNDSEDGTTLKKRTFKANTWNAVCFPFALSSMELRRVFGDNYKVYTCKSYGDNTVYFVEHANDYIEAGRPFFIYAAKAGEMHFENVTIEGKTLVKTSDGTDEWYTPITDPTRFELSLGDEYTFKGTYGKEDLPAYSYFFMGNGLYRLGIDYAIGGYRAYMRHISSSTNNAKALKFSFTSIADGSPEETTTGILMLDDSEGMKFIEGEAAIYNINGQMIGKGADAINNAAHGVYIMNGKKFIK